MVLMKPVTLIYNRPCDCAFLSVFHMYSITSRSSSSALKVNIKPFSTEFSQNQYSGTPRTDQDYHSCQFNASPTELHTYCTVCPTGLQAVIPLLKEHMAGSCSAELLLQIRQLVVGLTLSQMKQEVWVQYESKKHWTEVTYSNFEVRLP